MKLRCMQVMSTLAAALCGAQVALADEPTVMGAAASAPQPARFDLRSVLASRAVVSSVRRPADAGFGFASGIQVVELPPVGTGPGRQRAHHALSFQSDTPKHMLRAIGIDATECATRLRMPSKLRQDREGVNFEIQAQVGFACKF